MRLERYSREHRHFVAGARLPPLLAEVARPGVIADLGCGDGAVLAALEQLGLLEASFAIDLSPERVAAAERAVPSTVGIVASASATGLPDASVDGVVCSQVIEHIPDDRELAPELARILRPGGWFYVGSVLRHRHAFWFYKVEGVRRLDPTHVREYGSLDELLRALADPGLRAASVRTRPASTSPHGPPCRLANLPRTAGTRGHSSLGLPCPRPSKSGYAAAA